MHKNTHTHTCTLLRFDLHSPYCTSYSLPLCLCVQRSVAASLAPPAGRVSHHRAYVWGNGVAAWQSRRQPSHQRPAFSARLPCNSRDLPHQRGGAIARQKCSESFSLSSSASSWSFCLCCCCLRYCRCFPGARSKRAPEPTRRLNSQNRREIRVHAEGRKAFWSSVKESNHWCFSIALFFSLVVFFFFSSLLRTGFWILRAVGQFPVFVPWPSRVFWETCRSFTWPCTKGNDRKVLTWAAPKRFSINRLRRRFVKSHAH